MSIRKTLKNRLFILPFMLLTVALGACESSFDEASDAFFANQAPPAGGGGSGGGSGGGGGAGGSSFGPNFSEIQTNVFTPNCATSGCHAGSGSAGLNLEAANSYMNIVGVASSQQSGLQLINPGNPNDSYLIQKMEGTAASGGVMPPSGSIEQASIDTIRQWVSDGAIDDTAPSSSPIRVASLSVTPNSTLDEGPPRVTAGFDREPDASTVNATTFLLQGAGGDDIFGNGNDVDITAASISVPTSNTSSAVFDLAGVTLADDLYRVVLRGSGASIILDLDGNALDGEFGSAFPSGNGTAGGDFIAFFTVATPVALAPNLDAIQAAIFQPDCATSGCHDATTQAGSLSLADADTSYAEMVGEFSNQVGQENVMLVAAGDPDASYLIRKMENTAGITGAVMPPAGMLPQSEIDVIRQWITDGANR